MKIIGVGGVLFGIAQFFIANKEERKLARQQAAIKLIDQYNSDVSEKVEDIDFYLDPIVAVKGIGAFRPQSASRMQAAEVEDIFNAFYLGQDSERAPLASKWLDTLRYYDNVELCLSMGVCDEKYLKGFLCRRAMSFWAVQETFVGHYNSRFKDRNSGLAGEGLQNLVKRCAVRPASI